MPVPYAFNDLSLEERMAYINQHGEFISSDPSVPSNFYTLGEYYAEVVLDTAATAIVHIRAFNTGEHYERMLDRMDIGGR